MVKVRRREGCRGLQGGGLSREAVCESFWQKGPVGWVGRMGM